MLAHEKPRVAPVDTRGTDHDTTPGPAAPATASRVVAADSDPRRRDDALAGLLARSVRRRTLGAEHRPAAPLRHRDDDAPAVAARGGADLGHTLDGAKDKEGACGFFERYRDFDPPDGKLGVIVQEITRTFNVHKADGTPLVGAQIDAYINPANKPNGSWAYATETTYWEVWHITTAGKGDVDEFTLCSIIPPGKKLWDTTYGTFVMAGRAAFYENETPASLGFTANEAKCAGMLLSRLTAPALPIGKKVGPDLTHTVTVTWDSRSTTSTAPYAYESKVT